MLRVIALASLALLIPTTATAGARLSRQQVINRGDNACYAERTADGAAWRRHKPFGPFATDYRNWASLESAYLKASKRAVRKLSRLLKRAEKEKRVHLRAYVRGRKKLDRYHRRVIRAAETGDYPTYRARVYTYDRRNAKNRPRGRRYGFEVCGKK